MPRQAAFFVGATAGLDLIDYPDQSQAREDPVLVIVELKRQLGAARKVLATARAKEAAARQAYEKEVNAVDQVQRKPQTN